MANKIIIKKSSVASKVPLATDLDVGELAVNLVDQKLYSKKADGTVILVGSGLGGAGDVQGPASSTSNGIVRFSGTSGKILKNSTAQIDDSGNAFLAGSVPKSWNAASRVVQMGDAGVINGGSTGSIDTWYGANWYYDGTNDKRILTGKAARVGFTAASNKLFALQYGANGSADAAVTFQDAMLMSEGGVISQPTSPRFLTYNGNASQQIFTGGVATYSYVNFNNGSCYNSGNGRFTAPVAGLYLFSFAARNEVNTYGRADIRYNGGTYFGRLEYGATSTYYHNEITVLMYLNANDYVDVYVTGSVSGDPSAPFDHFSGCLIS